MMVVAVAYHGGRSFTTDMISVQSKVAKWKLKLVITKARLNKTIQEANNKSSEVFDIIKPGRRFKIKGYRQ